MLSRPVRGGTILLIAVVLTTFLGGCWDRREITDLAKVLVIGIDQGDEPGRYVLTLQISSSGELGEDGGGGGGRPPNYKAAWVVTTDCITMSHALSVASQLSSRRLYFGHTRAIVFGEEVAREGIRDILDFFQREHDFRRSIRIMVAKGTTARRVLEANPRLAEIPPLALLGTLQWSEDMGNTLSVRLGEYLFSLNSPGIDPIASAVMVVDNRKIAEVGELVPVDQQSVISQEENILGIDRDSLELRVGGNAIFQGDRLVDWLDVEEIKGYMMAMNQAKTGVIWTNYPGTETKLSYQVLQGQTKIRPLMEDGQLGFIIEAKVEAALVEQMGGLRLTEDTVQEKILQALEDRVEDHIRKAVVKAQNYETDIFGFGELLYRTHPQRWKDEFKDDWGQTFGQLPVSIQVEGKIRNIGIVTDGSHVRS